MFETSITRFLVVSLTTLMAGLLFTSLILAIQAWEHYALAGRIERLTDTDRHLFNALITVRAQIPRASTALLADDNPTAVIDAAHAEAAGSIAHALRSLQAADLENRAAVEGSIRQAWMRSESMQSRLQRSAAQPRGSRDLHEVDAWRDAIHDTTDALNAASAAIGNAIRIGDPLVAEMVQVRRTSWNIRDHYGLQCSLLRANIEKSTTLTSAQIDVWLGHRATYTAGWHTLDEYLLRPGVSRTVMDLVETARAQTSTAQSQINEVVARLDNSGSPAMDGAAWTAMCDGPFNAILAIAQQTQEEASSRALAIRAAAFRTLLLSGMGLLAVVSFVAYSLVTIQRRLARPMRSLISTIARFSRRQFGQSVPGTERPDELGRMAQALEALRASALETERLQLTMSRFTADASHQMRTPLSVLHAHISVLHDLIPEGSEAYASLKDIQDAADRLKHLLIQLLRLARAESGTSGNPAAEVIDLRQVVQETAAKHATQASESGLDLHFEAEDRKFPSSANPIVVSEIVANLLDNAIRYNHSGSDVTVRLFDQGMAHVIDVEDDGPGIPENEYNKVFKRFYRMNRDQGRSGSGLGLAIVESFAAILNADISLSPGDGQRGLRVRVSFPRSEGA